MNSKYIRKHLMPSLMAGMFLFLAACQGTSQDTNGRIAKNGDPKNAGLNGLVEEDAALKTIRQDSKKVLTYLTKAAPAFTALGSETGTSWDKLIDVKRWYMGGKENAKALTDFVSLTTLEGTADYVVYQSLYDVFVDTVLLGKLAEDKQNKLLLQEFLTSLFSLKHLDDNQLCALMQKQFKVEKCANSSEGARAASEDTLSGDSTATKDGEVESTDLESNERAVSASDRQKKAKEEEEKRKNLSPTKKTLSGKSLTGDDKEKILAAVEYIKALKADEKLNTAAVIAQLHDLDFDTRVFDYQLGVTAASTEVKKESEPVEGTKPKIEITSEQFAAIIKDMEAAVQKELICSGTGEAPSKCSLLLKKVDEKEGASKVSMTIKVNDKVSISDEVILNLADKTIGVGKYHDPVSALNYIVMPLRSVALAKEKRVEDSRYRGYFLLAVESESGLKFSGVFSGPGIIKSVAVDEKGRISCEGSSYYGAQSNEDGSVSIGPDNLGIYASVYNTTLDYSFAHKAVPAAPCY